MIHKKYDIAILGIHCRNDLILASYLQRLGLKCIVLRSEAGDGAVKVTDSSRLEALDGGPVIHVYKNRMELLKFLMQSRSVISFTFDLMIALGKMYLTRWLPGFPPIINWATGSDMTEVMNSEGRFALLYRLHLKFSALNVVGWQGAALNNIIRYNLPNVIVSPGIYQLLDEEPLATKKDGEPLNFFHASVLDWKESDPGEHRKSSKGNNRFIRAFARAVKDGLNAKCVILDRGNDREKAKSLIEELGAADSFVWKAELTRDQFHKQLVDCDVVVDQFEVGMVGGIGVEALSLGRPVLAYINKSASEIRYNQDLPPVLSAYTEDEIYERLMACRDSGYVRSVGKESRQWVVRNHHWSDSFSSFLFYYSKITGHAVKDYEEIDCSA